MEVGCVIIGLDSKLVPGLGIQVNHRTELLGCESEQPVTRRVCGDMSLIYAAYGEAVHDTLMGLLGLNAVLLIEGTLMLIYHDSIGLKSLVATAVELTGKQTLTRSVETGRVNYYKVILILNVADKTQGVLSVDGHARIIK